MTICKRCVAWLLSLLLMGAIVLPGCDASVNLSPDIQPASYQAKTYQVVTGTLDGINTDFKADVFTCNLADNFLYRTEGGVAMLNTDSTQVQCDPVVFNRVNIQETDRPLFVDG